MVLGLGFRVLGFGLVFLRRLDPVLFPDEGLQLSGFGFP